MLSRYRSATNFAILLSIQFTVFPKSIQACANFIPLRATKYICKIIYIKYTIVSYIFWQIPYVIDRRYNRLSVVSEFFGRTSMRRKRIDQTRSRSGGLAKNSVSKQRNKAYADFQRKISLWRFCWHATKNSTNSTDFIETTRPCHFLNRLLASLCLPRVCLLFSVPILQFSRFYHKTDTVRIKALDLENEK